MKIKKILLYLGGVILVMMMALIIYLYPFYTFFFTDNSTIIDEKLTMISGAGNSCLLETDSAIVVIDTKMGKMGKNLEVLARGKANNKKIIVINTHIHGDHIYGNRNFKNCTIYMGAYGSIFAKANIEPEDYPTHFVKDSIVLKLGDETLVLYNIGQAHTFADMVIYMKTRKLLVSGDLIFNQIHPALIREDGTNIEKWNRALDILPGLWEIQTIIPGHGNPGGIDLLLDLKTYFIDLKKASLSEKTSEEILLKYKSWMKMPLMSSTERTLDYIRENP